MEKKTNKKVKIIALILVITFVLVAAGSWIGVILYENSEYKINSIDFFEKSTVNFSLNEEQRQNVNNFLEEKYVTVDNNAGFSAFSDTVSLDKTYDIYQLADSINNDSIKNKLKNEIDSLKKIDIASLDMLNLQYYLFLCKEYNLTYDKNAIKTILDKHYDSDLQLLDMNGKNDTLGSKILFSSNILATVGDWGYNLQNGLTKVYSTYQFKLPKDGDTLYNSGGDIIYALNQNGLFDFKQNVNVINWFNAWKDDFSTFSIKNDIDALIYAGYLDIATIFDSNFLDSKNLMQSYFESFQAAQFSTNFEPVIWAAIMKYVKTPQNNIELYNKLIELINNKISNLVIQRKNIDIAETAYGVALANLIGFKINKNFINNTLNDIYMNYVLQNANIHQMVYSLYYYLYTYEINNNLMPTINVMPFSAKQIQNVVNKVLNSLQFTDETLLNDLLLARYTVDIVANAKVFFVDVRISKKQAKKLINALNKFKNQKNQFAVFMIDLYRLDYILKSNIFTESSFKNLIDLMKKNDKNFPSNIYNAYLIYTACDYFPNIDTKVILAELNVYINKLESSAGIFKVSAIDEANLCSTLYGNIIRQVQLEMELRC